MLPRSLLPEPGSPYLSVSPPGLRRQPFPAPASRSRARMSLPPLRLKRDEDRRLRAGHLWIFSNEVDVAATPLSDFEPGEPVEVQDHRGAPLGSAYVNPRSLIAARLVSRQRHRTLEDGLLVERLRAALRLRDALFPGPYYRLVFGEGDYLPGLVVDRFGDVVVAQVTTAGMERVRSAVLEGLREVVAPGAVLLRNDAGPRALEGLDSSVEVGFGEVPEHARILENGAHFDVPVRTGQKTGWFYDHRQNRARLQRYARGGRLLDLFSYVGGWGIQAAVAGAVEVLAVDASEAALAELGRNAALNGVEERVRTLRGDAFETVRSLRDDGERFDVVVVDPPAFIKRKKDAKAGEQAYRRINELALGLVAPGGYLVSASCSYHFSRDALRDAILRAGRATGRELQLVEEGHQGPDHPVHPAIPETAYLKAFFARAAG
jgi:23S rRNA (cytosine1962-C5)-methyltransferase